MNEQTHEYRPLIPVDDQCVEEEAETQGSEGTYFSDSEITPRDARVSFFCFLFRVKASLIPSQSWPTLRKHSTVIGQKHRPTCPRTPSHTSAPRPTHEGSPSSPGPAKEEERGEEHMQRGQPQSPRHGPSPAPSHTTDSGGRGPGELQVRKK